MVDATDPANMVELWVNEDLDTEDIVYDDLLFLASSAGISRGCTTALTSSPKSSLGTPNTATSITLGWVTSRSNTPTARFTAGAGLATGFSRFCTRLTFRAPLVYRQSYPIRKMISQ